MHLVADWLKYNLYFNRVLLIGIAALVFGAIAVWFAARSQGRPIRDAVALILGGLILTAAMMGTLFWIDRFHLSRGPQRLIVEVIVLGLALAVCWAGNRVALKSKQHHKEK
jgi:hypothetical protein